MLLTPVYYNHVEGSIMLLVRKENTVRLSFLETLKKIEGNENRKQFSLEGRCPVDDPESPWSQEWSLCVTITALPATPLAQCTDPTVYLSSKRLFSVTMVSMWLRVSSLTPSLGPCCDLTSCEMRNICAKGIVNFPWSKALQLLSHICSQISKILSSVAGLAILSEECLPLEKKVYAYWHPKEDWLFNSISETMKTKLSPIYILVVLGQEESK